MIVLQIIGAILLGAAVLIGGVMGLAYVIAKSVDHASNCSCIKCQNIRQRQWNKSRNKADRFSRYINMNKKQAQRVHWYSTAELKEGMHVVSAQKDIFTVISITPRTYGVVVELANVLDATKRSWIIVHADRLTHKMWYVVTGRRLD